MSRIAKSVLLFIGMLNLILGLRAQAQLAITEVMSSASTNLGPNVVIQNSDYWELTNFGANTIELTGYKFDDSENNLAAADPTPFDGLSIRPGESILFVQNNFTTNVTQFKDWWGASLPTDVKVVFYTGNGLSSGGDGLRLWSPSAQSAAEVVDSVDFGEAARGVSFTYDPVTGEFGVLSTNQVSGAFKALATDDVGSPGRAPGPVPVSIVGQPTDVVVNPGDTATLEVTVRGRPRGTFQWHFKDSPIEGATNTSLRIMNAQSATSGAYHVTVNNGARTVTSRKAQLVLQSEAAAPVLTMTPTDLLMYFGQSFTFSAVATGVPQPTFQWQLEGRNIDGANGAELSLSNVSEQDTGLYSVIARNAVAAITNSMQVTVTPKPRLLVTEVMSSWSTNAASHADWWELTNLGNTSINLKGFRFDDNSEMLPSAFTFTNDVAIASGESVIFVEGMTPEGFRAWWGSEHLLPGLKVLTYRGNGLSSAGDAVNIWNAAATDDAGKLASVVFSTATSGVTFGFNPDSGQFGELSQEGVFGSFIAASGGDIGSPGYIRNSQRVFLPRIREVAMAVGKLRLSWTSQVGTQYALQSKARIDEAAWTTLKTMTASETSTTVEEPLSAVEEQRFFRVVLAP